MDFEIIDPDETAHVELYEIPAPIFADTPTTDV